MKFLVPILSLFLIAALPAFAGEETEKGGWSSSGGDNRSFASGSAWYLGSAPVTVCLEMNPEFGVSPTEVERSFLQAAGVWQKYIADKHIDYGANHDGVDMKLNLNFQFLPSCTGAEDLKLYLGVENAEVLAEKAHYENPYAFAVRRSYDLSAGRGKGFLWFAQTKSVYPKAGAGFPDWTRPPALLGMMIHELGHVLGCGHVEGTIMQESLMSTIQYLEWAPGAKRAEASLSRIDDAQLLVHHPDAPFDYDGNITYQGYRPEEQRASFEYVTGRKPVGKITARYYRAAFGQAKYLELKDEKGTERYQVLADLESYSGYAGENPVFRVSRGTGQTSGSTAIGWSRYKQGFTQFGWIEAKGKKISILISENMNDLSRPFRLRYLKDGQSFDLFNARLPGMDDESK